MTSCGAAEDQTDSHKDEDARIKAMLILKAVIRGIGVHLSEAAVGGSQKRGRQKFSEMTVLRLEMQENIEDK